MKKSKSFYKSLNLNGFTWFCYDHKEDVHVFSKPVAPGASLYVNKSGENGYYLLAATDDDIDNGNALAMAEKGLTRCYDFNKGA